MKMGRTVVRELFWNKPAKLLLDIITKPWLASSLVISSALCAEGAIRYVDEKSANPTAPYITWATAATEIQHAVDAAEPGDTVLVTNGVYRAGGKALNGGQTNRVAVDKAIELRSVNGPLVTIIEGSRGSWPGDASVVRCLNLQGNARASGFTLQHGSALDYGGGVLFGSVSNCVIVSNSAGVEGGGAYGTELTDCTLTQNSSAQYGGAAAYARLERCIVNGNSAQIGGGSAYCGSQNSVFTFNRAFNHGGADFAGTLYNCTVLQNQATEGGGGVSESMVFNSIVYSNSAKASANFSSSGFYYSCTFPQPTGGAGGANGNTTNAPALNGVRLSSNSPCINAGSMSYPVGALDASGQQRVVGGSVDMGAYEYGSPASGASHAWLQRYGFSITNGVDLLDTDGDGANNLHEWLADTNPTNALSVLKLSLIASPGSNVVSFTSSTQRKYDIYYGVPASGEIAWQVVTNFSAKPGSGMSMSLVDTNAAFSRLYRVEASRR